MSSALWPWRNLSSLSKQLSSSAALRSAPPAVARCEESRRDAEAVARRAGGAQGAGNLELDVRPGRALYQKPRGRPGFIKSPTASFIQPAFQHQHQHQKISLWLGCVAGAGRLCDVLRTNMEIPKTVFSFEFLVLPRNTKTCSTLVDVLLPKSMVRAPDTVPEGLRAVVSFHVW